MTNPISPSNIIISPDDFHHKISSMASEVNASPKNEALYYTLLTPIENVISSSNKDIIHGPQLVLKNGQDKRIPDVAIMRILSEVVPQRQSTALELLAIIEVKSGPCGLPEWPDDGEPQSPPPIDDAQVLGQHNTGDLEADRCFKALYQQICEQASHALVDLPPHRSIPVFFLTGFYFSLIVFDGEIMPVQVEEAPLFDERGEDAGYNPVLAAEHEQLVRKQLAMALKHEVKYFNQRYIDHRGHLTAEFAAALRWAIEDPQGGPVLVDSWFTTLAEQGVANDERLAKAEQAINDAVESALRPHRQAIANIRFSKEEGKWKAEEDKRTAADSDFDPNDSDNKDADSSNNADTSMSTTSDSPIVRRPDQAAWILNSPRSELSSATGSSPEVRQWWQGHRRVAGPDPTWVLSDDGSENNEYERMPTSPTPRSGDGLASVITGYGAAGSSQAGGRTNTGSEMDWSE